MTPIKILLADDHVLILEGLTSLIQKIAGFSLFATASTAEGAIEILQRSAALPDVCMLDAEMPGMGGMAAIKIIKERYPSVKVAILTMHNEPFFSNRAIKEGADGFLLKDFNSEFFENAIQLIVQGKRIEPLAIEAERKEQNAHTPELTSREKVIIRLIADGKSNKEIAKALFISIRTVDVHRTNILRKLNATSRVQMVHYAYANNLI